jgi:GNAT superfamily N-acetyltransferase
MAQKISFYRRSARHDSYNQMQTLIGSLSAIAIDQRPSAMGRSREHKEHEYPGGYSVRQITRPGDRNLRPAHRFMKFHFGDESETYGWFVRSMRDGLNQYFVVEDEQRRIIGLSNSQYLRIKKTNTDQTAGGQAIFVVWHIAIDELHRGKGLAKILYATIYRHYLMLARRRRHEILAIVGEAVSSVETFLNALGRRRLYFKSEKGWEEVSYMCPPLDYDPHTGLVNGAMVNEHLMVRFIDGREVASLEIVAAVVETMHREYIGRVDDYFSYKAYRTAKAHIESLDKEFREKLDRARAHEVYLLSQSDLLV